MIDEFEAANATIYGISPDDGAERVAKMVEDHELTFPVLHDTGLEVAKAYGIVNQDNTKVPHPTVIVVDEQGIVRWIHLDEDYTKRPSPESVLEAVRGAAPTEESAGR